MQSDKEAKIQTEKELTEVTEFITKSSLEPGNIIIHHGSNDLNKGSVEEVNNQFRELINWQQLVQ